MTEACDPADNLTISGTAFWSWQRDHPEAVFQGAGDFPTS
jgi:hypothetical protein